MAADGEEVLVNLKILSPSTEVGRDINLVDLPATTTVQELRQRIRNEIESRPNENVSPTSAAKHPVLAME